MPAHDLVELLRRLHGEAGMVLAGAQGSREDVETNERFQRGHDGNYRYVIVRIVILC